MNLPWRLFSVLSVCPGVRLVLSPVATASCPLSCDGGEFPTSSPARAVLFWFSCPSAWFSECSRPFDCHMASPVCHYLCQCGSAIEVFLSTFVYFRSGFGLPFSNYCSLGLEILGASLRAWRWGGLHWLQIESAGPSGLVCGDMASHLLIQEEEPAPALGSYLFFSPGRQRSGLTHSRFQISLLRFSSPMLWVILGQQWSHVCPLDTLRRQVSCWVAKEHFPSEWTTRAGPQDLTERLHLALA